MTGTTTDDAPFSRGTWWIVGVLFTFAAAIAILGVWLVIETITVLTADAESRPDFDFLGFGTELGTDGLTLILALGAGVVGGMIHFITSLAKYAGTKKFKRRWTVWFLARPLLGGLLAVIVYLVIRAGLLPSAEAAEVVSPYGVAAFAGLAGMFSKQAIDWLERLFNSAFTGGEQLPDRLGTQGEEGEAPTEEE